MKTVVGLVAAAVLTAVVPAEAGKPLPVVERQVVGTSRSVEVLPNLAEATDTGSGRLWSHLVRVDGATFLKPHFVDVNLRAGDAIVVRSRSGQVVEVVEGRGPKQLGSFWGLSAMGDMLLLELHFRHDYSRAPFEVDQVIVGDTDLFTREPSSPESICAPEDFDDVICYQDDAGKWANVTASVGVMTVGGNPATGLWCSGSNISPLNYLLTNQHCVESQAGCDTSEFVFKYYRTACNTGAPPTADWQGFHCLTQVAVSPYGGLCEPNLDNLDFSLTSVVGDPTAAFGSVTVDSTALTSGEAVYIVQDPNGRPQEIAHGSGADVVVDGHTVRYYGTLDTEPGSSGSPIFREGDDKLVALHHCGGCETPGVGNRGMLMSEIYPLIEQYLCSPTLEVEGDGYEQLGEVEGNGNAVLDPGETWSFVPRVKNKACSGDALDVAADLELNATSATPVTLLDTDATFGTVAAGESALAAEAVAFTLDPTVVCGETVMVDLYNLTASNGGPFADTRPLLSHQVGELVKTVLFSEDFSAGLGAWTVVDGGTGSGPAATWTTANPGGKTPAGLTAPFAIADSDALGNGYQMNEELISPPVDCTGYAQVELQYNHVFDYYSGSQNEQGDVDVRSTGTGGEWVRVANYSGADAAGNVILDVTAQAAGASDLQVRFHYYDALYEWYWAVDDVSVLGNNGVVCEIYAPGAIFADGFETGDTTRWSLAVQ